MTDSGIDKLNRKGDDVDIKSALQLSVLLRVESLKIFNEAPDSAKCIIEFWHRTMHFPCRVLTAPEMPLSE